MKNETSALRKSRDYVEAVINHDVFHYRDKSGLESDLIVRLREVQDKESFKKIDLNV